MLRAFTCCFSCLLALNVIAHTLPYVVIFAPTGPPTSPTYHSHCSNYAHFISLALTTLIGAVRRDARIIWHTITPVPFDPPPQCVLIPGRLETDVLRYNAAADAAIAGHQRIIEKCDLHGAITAHCGANYSSCDIAQCAGPHFTEAGFALLANASAACVTSQEALSAGLEPGPDLQQSFIWTPNSSRAQAYAAFRGSATLATAPPARSATLYIFADARYILFINGAYVARGPGRFFPSRPEFDSIDVSSFLQVGPNSVVVLAHNYGAGAINGRIISHTAGLTARLDISGATVLRTGPTWRCSNATQYRPSPVEWSSIPDTIDMRLAPAGGDWTQPAFDDSQWDSAVAVDGALWGTLQERTHPLPRETVVSGLTVMPSGAPLTLPVTLEPGAQIIVNLTAMALVYVDALVGTGDGGAVGSEVTVTFALRYINNVTSETYGVGSSFTLGAPGGGSTRLLSGDTWCAHYVTIALAKTALASVTLQSLKFVRREYPFERLGSFASNDELLTEVWRRAVNTLQAVTDDAYGSGELLALFSPPPQYLRLFTYICVC